MRSVLHRDGPVQGIRVRGCGGEKAFKVSTTRSLSGVGMASVGGRGSPDVEC